MANDVCWQLYSGDDGTGYSGGGRCRSTNSGTSWTATTDEGVGGFNFEIWGETVVGNIIIDQLIYQHTDRMDRFK